MSITFNDSESDDRRATRWALEGNDQLLAETRTIVRRIIAALPDEEMIRRCKAAEPVRVLAPLTP